MALVAVISGAAVISALLNLDLDIERKLTQEFRTLGREPVIAPRSGARGSQSEHSDTDAGIRRAA